MENCPCSLATPATSRFRCLARRYRQNFPGPRSPYKIERNLELKEAAFLEATLWVASDDADIPLMAHGCVGLGVREFFPANRGLIVKASDAREVTQMIRTVLTTTAVLLILGLASGAVNRASAADKKAQIKMLEDQKKQLRAQLAAHLKQVGDSTNNQVQQVRLQEGEMKKFLNARLEHEDREHQKRIEARFDNIMSRLKPQANQGKMVEEMHQMLEGVNRILKQDNPDYAGHRVAAMRSVGAADDRVKKVLAQDSQEERLQASKNMGAAVGDLGQALQYSWQKYGYFGYGNGVPRGMPKTQQASDAQLASAIPSIESAQWLLANLGLDKAQVEAKRQELQQKKEADKQAAHADYMARIKNVDTEVAAQIQQSTQALHMQAEQTKQKLRAQVAASIKQIDDTIAQLKKSK